MTEQQRKRVERAISDMINEMYSSHLRKMQSEMHICASKCCDDQRGTLESVQTCIEGCAVPLIKAQDYLQQELGQFQGQLQNCVMKCSEEARQRLPPSPGDVELAKNQYQFENCTVACVDRHIGLIPTMMKTIKAVLEKGPNAMPQA
ncbi:PREDICTED: protein FAM136A-like [Rhagoletis zephyria]|uniref:protein FAM136A-like n=1 Tax=Rhagoletis zephyria TaxID=28612 RepID=UPI0008117C19|nr:PREDICTED: protein FAM136A-like [Rhagoletis zephyria]